MLDKNYFKFKRDKKEVADIDIVESRIYVKYDDTYIQRRDLKKLYGDGYTPNVILEEYTGLNGIYCPQFLRTKIKYLFYEAKNIDEMFKKYNILFSKKIYELASFFSFNELFNPIIQYGKFISKYIDLSKIMNNYSKDEKALLKKVQKSFDEKLKSINRGKLFNKASKLVAKIGSPIKGHDNEFDWTDFTFLSLLSYLIVESYNLKDKKYNSYFNILVKKFSPKYDRDFYLEFYKEKVYRNELSNILYFEVNDIIDFAMKYLCRKYTDINIEYDYDDYLTEKLNDRKKYLLERTKDKKKYAKINNYSEKELLKSYKRRILKY